MRSPEDGVIEGLLSISDSSKHREMQRKVDEIMAAIIGDPAFKGKDIQHNEDGGVVVREGDVYKEVTLGKDGEAIIGEVVPFQPEVFEPRPPRKGRQPHPDAK